MDASLRGLVLLVACLGCGGDDRPSDAARADGGTRDAGGPVTDGGRMDAEVGDAALDAPIGDAAPRDAPADVQIADGGEDRCSELCGALVEPCTVYSPPEMAACLEDCRALPDDRYACLLQAYENPDGAGVGEGCRRMRGCIGR